MAFSRQVAATRSGEPVHIEVIGAGPAGLTAAHGLVQAGNDVTALEAGDAAGWAALTIR
ncbi:MAG: NAD(P)-binding protein [Chloroflexi bacterium]|nr:NAD(P)-binding protein [Chloroflexota bacterium]